MNQSLDELLSKLNKEQFNAATTSIRHTLVLAGAGCGKTSTLVGRAAFLIGKEGVPAHKIQLLSFTKKSATEIGHRVNAALGNKAHGIGASTFHTWCLGLIRSAPDLFQAKQITVLDREDQEQIMRWVRASHTSKGVSVPLAPSLCNLYSYIRNTLKPFNEAYAKYTEGQEESEESEEKKTLIKKMLIAYEEKKRERSYLDFDDIIDWVARALEVDEEVVDYVSSRAQFILVDEMQDTNPLQWKLLEQLTERSILFCVGDAAQSIYGFRGADYKNVYSFKERLPDSQTLSLQQNYRSTQEILDVSNWLMSCSQLSYGTDLKAVRGAGLTPKICTFSSDQDEAHWIAKDIKERHATGTEFKENMILVRTSTSGRNIEAALLNNAIPYQFVGGSKLMESAHVKDCLAALRIVANPRDEMGWMRYLTLFAGVGDNTARAALEAFSEGTDFSSGLKLIPRNTKIEYKTIELLQLIFENQQKIEFCLKEIINLLKPILAEKYRNNNWDLRIKDFDLVLNLSKKHSSISEFMEEYILNPVYSEEFSTSSPIDKVTLITIHSAKGSESNICYVANVSPGRSPILYAMGDEEKAEEERRVLYVALTRARNELIITRGAYSIWSARSVGYHTRTNDRTYVSYFLNGLPIGILTEVFPEDPDWRMHKRDVKKLSEKGTTKVSISVGIKWD